MRFQQIAAKPFPHGGLPIAEVAVEPVELELRQGVRFEHGTDGLGHFQLAAFALTDATQAWLIKHLDAPYSGMLVIADAADTPSRLQGQVLDAFDLDDKQLTWVLADEDRGAPQGFF